MSLLGLALAVLIGVTLGFFGGGGSILTVPLLVYVFGIDAKPAIAGSLLVVCAASLSGALLHWRAGNVELRRGLFFAAAAVPGAYLGGRAGAFVDGSLLLMLFAAMMLLTATVMWRGRRGPIHPSEGEPSARRLLAQGFGVGVVTGSVGAGGGFLIVPALTLWGGLPMPAAVGTSLMIIVLNSLAGFSGYASHIDIDVPLVAAVAAAAVAGSLAGSRLAYRIDPSSLRKAFAGFVALMALLIVQREADAFLATGRDALPVTAPQIAFALVMLGIGISVGRVTRRTGTDPFADGFFTQGAGI